MIEGIKTPANNKNTGPIVKVEQTKNPKQEELIQNFLKNLSMYNLPDYDPINEEDIRRYVESNEKLLQNLPKLIEDGLKHDDRNIRRMSASMISLLPENEQEEFIAKLPNIIEDGLNSDNFSICKDAISMIKFAPENKRSNLILLGLNSKFPNIRVLAAQAIEYASKYDRDNLKAELTRIVQEGLNHNDLHINFAVIPLIAYVSHNEIENLMSKIPNIIERGLKHNDPNIRRESVLMIKYAPHDKMGYLLEMALNDDNLGVCMKTSYILYSIPEDILVNFKDRLLYIAKCGLNNVDEDICIEAISMIRYVEENQRAHLLEIALDNKYKDVRKIAVNQIQSAPETQRTHLLEISLNDKERGVRKMAAQMIRSAIENKRVRLLEIALKDENEDISTTAFTMLPFVSKTEREHLLEKLGIAINNLEEFATQTPFYGEKEEKFFRKDFKKTHSTTTLLNSVPGQEDNSLKEKVIIRHIKLFPYLMWKKAFESFDVWKEMGFSYIPVEPIIRIGKNVNVEKVDVFTRVLCGPSVEQWKRGSLLFLDEINEQIEKIEEGLNKLYINHNDLHEGNFVLLFEKTEDGHVDFSKPPRVYVIDFEFAVQTDQ